jgi:hypothetical protein
MRNVRELRGVSAGWKVDADVIRDALAGVIDAEALANLAGLDADGGVLAGVIGSGPAEDIDSDSAFLERIAAAGQSVFHNVAEEFLAAAAGAKLVAVEDAV